MKIKQIWVDNPRQDFWARFHAAIERKTGHRFYTDRVVKGNRFLAYLIPHEATYLLPCGRNKPNATYWLEVGENEPFYTRILEDFRIELSDFWDKEPYW